MTFLCLLVVIALLLTPNVTRANDQCSKSRANNLKLSVTSRQNQTGHWVVKTDLLTVGSGAVGNIPREVLLDVDHGSEFCTETNTVHVVATATLSDVKRLEGYEFFHGLGYYRIHATALSWDAAVDVCVKEDAHLLVLNSNGELDVVEEFFMRKIEAKNSTHNTYIFLGIHDRVTEGSWVTLQGIPVATAGYARWYKGQPGGATEKNCGVIDKDGWLYDAPCSWRLMFVCERNSQ